MHQINRTKEIDQQFQKERIEGKCRKKEIKKEERTEVETEKKEHLKRIRRDMKNIKINLRKSK
jgi:hypothetical protein